MIPILDEVIADAAEAGTHHVLIGMAHRGRLNVLAHVLQKPYAQILAEFKDPVKRRTGYRIDLGWSGDVKYHCRRPDRVHGGAPTELAHLDGAEPEPSRGGEPGRDGMARAAGTRVNQRGEPEYDRGVTLPVLIHGDAAFPGQGVVAETLNLSRLAGYTTGGTIHIIANNQLGFTATPDESYSTSYASGLARGFKIPIVHVNADDPAACIEVARLAWAYRATIPARFPDRSRGIPAARAQRGRRAGVHAAPDVQRVASHPRVREIWAQTTRGRRGMVTRARPTSWCSAALPGARGQRSRP